jgi:uncharacterized protein with HEPN domain
MAIGFIEEFLVNTESFSMYSRDIKTKSAVERQLGIMAEAVNKYIKLSESNTLEFAPQIIAFRNRLIHSYDSVDDNIVWTIIKKHLSPLKVEVEKMILT